MHGIRDLVNDVFDGVPVFCDTALVDMLANEYDFCINRWESLGSTVFIDTRKLLLS